MDDHVVARECLRYRASLVLDLIDRDRERFEAMADHPGRRIHGLFAGLYGCTTRAWLTFLADHRRPEFAYLVVMRFYDLYRQACHADAHRDIAALPRHWRAYFSLAGKQTYAHPISAHLVLISLAARAHTRHDLALAIRRAHDDYQDQFGISPDLAGCRETVVGHDTGAAFRDAALDYIDLHFRSQQGWRRVVLRVFSMNIKLLRFVWLPIFQSWRNAAWNDACARIEAGRA